MTTTTTTPDRETTNSAVKSILSDNAKLRKLPTGARAIVAGIMLAPSKRSGVVNVCKHASPACILICVLWFAGRTVTKTVRAAATKRTRLWHFFPAVFYSRLRKELSAMVRRAFKLGARAFCRLNTASDIDHPKELIAEFPTVTFYDYTKSVERCEEYLNGEWPENYHVSYSVSERSEYATVAGFLRRGLNVIVVFDSYYFGPRHRYGVIPSSVEFTNEDGSQSIVADTVDGDVHDIRTPEFDGRGRVVCLRGKGPQDLREKAKQMGFIFHAPNGATWFVDEYRSEGRAVCRLK